VLGRRAAFERVAELREAFARLFARSTELALVTGEMWPATRGADPVEDEEEGGEAVEGTVVMAGVEHLGQYVFEMTKAKVQMLKDTGGKLPALAKVEGSEDESEEEGEGVVEIVSGSEEDEEDDEEK
jgi:intron-binding protein aquarius